MFDRVLSTLREDKVFIRRLVFLAAIGLLALVLYQLRSVLASLAIAFIIAYILDPVVDWFEARKMSRVFSVVLILVFLSGLFALFALLILPLVVDQFRELFQILPSKISAAYAWIEKWIKTEFEYQLPQNIKEFATQLKNTAINGESGFLAPAAKWVGQSVGNVLSFVLGLLNLLIIPILAVFLLVDFDAIVSRIKVIVPEQMHASVGHVIDKIESIFSSFFRGQLFLVVLLAFLYSLGFYFAGVPLAIVVGCLSGFGQLIPYVGPAFGVGIGLLVMLTDFHGWWPIVYFLLTYIVIQNLEGWILTPRIVGKSAGLSVLGSILSLIIFGELFGFVGLLLAIPLGAFAKWLILEAYYKLQAQSQEQSLP